MRALLTLLFTLALAGCAGDIRSYQGLAERPANTADTAMLAALNRYRASQSPPLTPLVFDPRLAAIAQRHNEVMRDRIAQLGLNVGTTHWGDLGERLRQAGYSYRWAGENVAAGEHISVPDLFESLKESPTHNANLLSERARRIGIAVLREEFHAYVTQVFASQ